MCSYGAGERERKLTIVSITWHFPVASGPNIFANETSGRYRVD